MDTNLPSTVILPNEPVGRRVAGELRQAIVTMRIKPGEKLSEHEIAKRFGISRQPVREAFIKLAEAGLVRVLPQRGTLVTKISVEAVTDARFIREAIECAVVREAALRRDSATVAAIEECLEETARAVTDQETKRLFALDETFHQLLAKAAGRPASWRAVEEQKAQMDRVRYLDLGDAMPMRTILGQHRVIAKAVAEGDPAAAEAAMRRHLTEILETLPKLAAAWPELFEDDASLPAGQTPVA